MCHNYHCYYDHHTGAAGSILGIVALIHRAKEKPQETIDLREASQVSAYTKNGAAVPSRFIIVKAGKVGALVYTCKCCNWKDAFPSGSSAVHVVTPVATTALLGYNCISDHLH